jgi:5-methylcytosine-specific restriction protein A
MPRRPTTKTCPQPGCPNLQPCPDHAPKPWANSNRLSRLPKDWKTIRTQVLERDNHTCTKCGNRATDVDHVLRGDNHEPTNLTSLCRRCHASKSGREGAAARAEKRAATDW